MIMTFPLNRSQALRLIKHASPAPGRQGDKGHCNARGGSGSRLKGGEPLPYASNCRCRPIGSSPGRRLAWPDKRPRELGVE